MSETASTPIELFGFRAGDVRLGIVAAAVVRVVPLDHFEDAARCPHVSTLLALPASPAESDRRLVLISCAGRRARLIVDGPIRLGRIGARDLLPLGRGLRLPSLLGFAIENDALVLLLNIGWLSERAIAHDPQAGTSFVDAS